jgi:signal peptidase I
VRVLKTNARGAIFYVLVAVVIVLGAELIIDDASGGSPVYVIVSRSMSPTLEVGDMVVVRNVPFNSIHVGDIVVFSRPAPGGTCGAEIIVHRVVGITSGGDLITQGDNQQTNPMPDEPTEWPYVTANCVKGEVVMSIPYLGSVSMLFPPPYDYVLMAAILVLIFLIELRGDKDEADEPSTSRAASRCLQRFRRYAGPEP